MMQARFTAGKSNKRTNGGKVAGSLKMRIQGSRDTRKLDFDIGNDDEIAETPMAGFDRKAKVKRCWTLKQETHADRVIEEGSDDSFASDTPAQAHHRKRTDTKVIDGFSQAQLNFEYTYDKMNAREIGNENERERRRTDKDAILPEAEKVDQLEIDVHDARVMANGHVSTTLMNNSMSNKRMKNDSSVFASKNSLGLTRPSQIIDNSPENANSLEFTSNRALPAAGHPSVHRQQ